MDDSLHPAAAPGRRPGPNPDPNLDPEVDAHQLGRAQLAAAVAAGDEDAAATAAMAWLRAGATRHDVAATTVGAASAFGRLDRFAPYGFTGLLCLEAAWYLSQWLGERAADLAAVWGAYHVALGLRGVPPSARGGGPAVPGIRPSGADGTDDDTDGTDDDVRALFAAATGDLGPAASKLPFAAGVWRLARDVAPDQRAPLLAMSRVHSASSQRPADAAAADRVWHEGSLAAWSAAAAAGLGAHALLPILDLVVARAVAQGTGDRFAPAQRWLYLDAAHLALDAVDGVGRAAVGLAALWVQPLLGRDAGALGTSAVADSDTTAATPAGVTPADATELLEELALRAVLSGTPAALRVTAAAVRVAHRLSPGGRHSTLLALRSFLRLQSGEAPSLVAQFERTMA